MKADNLFNQNNISKGGIIGAVTGAAASTQFHKKSDHIAKKALKTGIFAGLGYLLGSIIEKLLKKNN